MCIAPSKQSEEEKEELKLLLTLLKEIRKEERKEERKEKRKWKDKYFKQYGGGLTYFHRMEAWIILRNEFGLTDLEKPTFDFSDHAICKFLSSQSSSNLLQTSFLDSCVTLFSLSSSPWQPTISTYPTPITLQTPPTSQISPHSPLTAPASQLTTLSLIISNCFSSSSSWNFSVPSSTTSSTQSSIKSFHSSSKHSVGIQMQPIVRQERLKVQ